ncbi:MAG: CPBP family intramembrane metalloprotease [Clostridia bacterium]|nr:CPBP family intramembrane metalloprotease [Clostridia bacterium]
MKIKSHYAAPVLMIVISALMVAARAAEKTEIENPNLAALTYVILNFVVFVIPAFIYSRLREKDDRVSFRIRWPSGFHVVFLAVSSLCLFFVSLSLGILSDHLFSDAFRDSALTSSSLYSLDGSFESVLRVLLAFALVPALCEEFVFRSVLLREYERFGMMLSSLIGATFFAMIHFHPVRFPIYFVCGWILSVIAFATDSFVSSAIAHFVCNTGVLLLENYVTRSVNTGQNGSVLLLFLVLLLTLLFLFLFLATAQKLFREKSEKPGALPLKPEEKLSKNLKTVLFSPPLWIFVVMNLIITFVAGL